MSDENVIKEGTGADGRTYRVRLLDDQYPDMPYDDGSVPLWRIDYSGLGWRTEQVKMTEWDAVDVRLGDAVNRFNGPTVKLVERWLKAYHGVTVVETWHSGEAWYLAADDADWRKAMGVSAERIQEEAARGSLMAEYKAWAQGEVYGYAIESKGLAITTVLAMPDGDIIDTRRVDEWREVDAPLFGLYGHAYALETATEDFHAHLRDLDKEVNASRYETVTLVDPRLAEKPPFGELSSPFDTA